ncbi:restriction endonuclease subunit S [Psittacicella melopsittaci]|uniref:restriction endonuclease subunit S n=1 Tax=Psittacicella melopsittaci TaxID=2028576 RepID=UPI00249E393E|nr:restriction endonuclease subunit S [Psittacicella melopsittaci]
MASLQQKLSAVEWGEYKIDDLFEKINTKKVKNLEGNLPATTAIISNNQIGRYVNTEGCTILENVFSATANGFGKTFYQPHKFTVLQDSYAFRFKDPSIKIEKVHHFITTSLNRVYQKYDWTNKSGWAKVKNETILLPRRNGVIDFEFIEDFVTELESLNITKIQTYLQTRGLDNYELNEEEIKALASFESLEWGEYQIAELFEKIATNKVQNKEGSLPATTAIISNNQIGRYVNEEGCTILENVFSATANGFGKAFYQPHKFTVLQDSYAFRFKDSSIKIEKVHPFITAALNKVYQKYDWSNKSGWEKIKKEYILLPTKNGQIDFEFIETYILALEKLVVKDLVKFSHSKTTSSQNLSF